MARQPQFPGLDLQYYSHRFLSPQLGFSLSRTRTSDRNNKFMYASATGYKIQPLEASLSLSDHQPLPYKDTKSLSQPQSQTQSCFQQQSYAESANADPWPIWLFYMGYPVYIIFLEFSMQIVNGYLQPAQILILHLAT